MYSQINLLKLLSINLFVLLGASPRNQCLAQSTFLNSNDLIQKLAKLPNHPRIVSFENSHSINNRGGHLQGVQMKNYEGTEYYIVTGSSNTISYYSVFKMEPENEVISVHKFLDLPYKHAGGFQINDKLMAVGIEDNELKTRSKVYVYSFEKPQTPPPQPLKVIEREGPAKRATAGCVAIAEVNGEMLLVVGNWDAVHLDFYRLPKAELNEPNQAFELFHTIDSRTVDRSGWIDKHWLSYQTINLIRDASDSLYLLGFTSADDKEVLDLFSLEHSGNNDILVEKIYSRQFFSSGKTRFRWGAGIYIGEKGEIRILACSENIGEQAIVAIYEQAY